MEQRTQSYARMNQESSECHDACIDGRGAFEEDERQLCRVATEVDRRSNKAGSFA